MTSRTARSSGRAARPLAALAVAVATLGACSGGDTGDTALDPVRAPGTSAAVTAGGDTAAPASGPGEAGSGDVGEGFVSIQLRLGASGVAETLTLDRGAVPLTELDPLSLDAYCSALDDGDGDWTVSVTDLRRLQAGQRLVSAVLHIDGPVEAPGGYEGSLEVGDAEQAVTRYDGTITVDDGLASGSFDLRDATGAAATGTFVCASEPVVATTLPAATLPPATGPGSTAPVATDAPPLPTGPPLPTVPAATS